jgi:hypothetical protein
LSADFLILRRPAPAGRLEGCSPDGATRGDGSRRAGVARAPHFAFMFRNSVHAGDLFKIPSRNFVEIGHRVEI